jgi:hypothetical protein
MHLFELNKYIAVAANSSLFIRACSIRLRSAIPGEEFPNCLRPCSWP